MGGGGGGGIGSAVGGIVGGIIGDAKASGDRSKSQGYAEQAYNTLIGIGVPPDLSKEIVFQKFQQAGILTPEVEKAIELTHSAQAQLQEAPETREAQMEALQAFKQLGATGLGAQDRAALSQIRDQVQGDLEAKRQQILQSAQARGMGGSGAELISQLQASQSGANLASDQGLQVAAQAQQRALAALGQSANLAGQVRGQDYTSASNRAQAEDEMNRFNVGAQQQAQTRNVAAKNIAQQANLQQKQKIQDLNVDQTNQELLRQREAQRQNWLDQVSRAQSQASGYQGMSNEYGQRADRIAGREQGIWTGIGGIAGTAAGAAFGAPSFGDGSMSPEGTLSGGSAYNERKMKNLMAHGGVVPGKALIPGDHIDNDTVDIKASPGEIIIPRSIAEHEKAPEVAKKFVDLVLSLKNSKSK